MALIKCPECGKEVSNTIEQCIHCGYYLHRTIDNTNEKQTSEENAITANTENGKFKECWHCHKQVAKLAVTCPHCGGNVRSAKSNILQLISSLIWMSLGIYCAISLLSTCSD